MAVTSRFLYERIGSHVLDVADTSTSFACNSASRCFVLKGASDERSAKRQRFARQGHSHEQSSLALQAEDEVSECLEEGQSAISILILAVLRQGCDALDDVRQAVLVQLSKIICGQALADSELSATDDGGRDQHTTERD